MHIPDGFLSAPVWGSLDVVSASLVGCGVVRVTRHLQEKAVPLMGVMAAFIFAAQMLNIPVGGGTSVHFLGGGLAGIVLGPWEGLVVMSTVLVVQCFLFQDGGLAALGANIFNMGVIGSMGGYFLYRFFRTVIRKPRDAIFLSSGLSMVLSALACAAEIGISGVIPWRVAALAMGGVHFLFGIAEGAVTAAVLTAIARRRPDLLRNFHDPRVA